jgi:hypothetical protein
VQEALAGQVWALEARGFFSSSSSISSLLAKKHHFSYLAVLVYKVW